jgi:Outer membrane protein/protective antigen OMA87
MLDEFQMGPNLVRGFAPAGIGPRDLTQFPFTGVLGDALGGSYYWGASLEFRTPLYFLPKDAGIKVAAFADAGSLWNYQGPTTFPRDRGGDFGQLLSDLRSGHPPTRCRVRWTTPCIYVARWAWE